MGQHKRTSTPIGLVILLLVLALLACNLTSNGDDEGDGGGGESQSDIPTVSILSPTPNTSVLRGTSVTVQVKAVDPKGSGVTRVELLVNNVRVDEKPSTSPLGDKELTLNLTWIASAVPGNYTLTIRPFRGNVQGKIESLPITIGSGGIAPTIPPTSGSGVTAPTGAPIVVPTTDTVCRARVDIAGLRMRSSPDSTRTDNIITEFAVNETPAVLARLADNSWYQVRDTTSPDVGWVYSAYVTLTGLCTNIPVISGPSTPIPPQIPTNLPASQPAELVALPLSGLTQIELGSDGTATAVYTMLIRNDGGQDSGAFDVLIVLPGGEQTTISVPSLAPRAVVPVPTNGLNVTFRSPGTQRVLYQIDSTNRIAEAKEDNNIAYLDVSVLARPTQ